MFRPKNGKSSSFNLSKIEIFISIEILKNVSFNWIDLLKDAAIYSIDKKFKIFNGKNIRWPIAEQYPSCQPLDLFDYFNMDANTPLQIFFNFSIVDNMQVTLLIEDRKKVTSRYFYPLQVWEGLLKPPLNKNCVFGIFL